MRQTEVVNARLKTVTGPASGDGWEASQTTGSVIWTGDLGVFFEETRRVVPSPGAQQGTGGVDAVTVRSLSVRSENAIAWETGQVVTFTYHGNDLTGNVAAVEGDPSPQGEGGEIRLTLDIA